MITNTQIQNLASAEGGRKIAIENFLGTLGDLTKREAVQNLFMDARRYNWNATTQIAILKGINLHYAK